MFWVFLFLPFPFAICLVAWLYSSPSANCAVLGGLGWALFHLLPKVYMQLLLPLQAVVSALLLVEVMG
jgi:hypothetical protein